MKLNQLKNWINSLSEDVMDYDVVYAAIERGEEEEDTIEIETYLNLVSVDDENKLVLILKNKE